MTIRERLILEILQIQEDQLLEQLQVFLKKIQSQHSNTNAVLCFAGSLETEEGQEIEDSLNNDFNQIEGDW